MRHVAEWRGHWLALLGWRSGAFKCAPRDRWLGWHASVQFRRLHLIGNNTRFLVLPAASGIANLASRSPSRSLRRLSDDSEAAHGHPLELAETFVHPERFRGTCYAASNWVRVGRTKGFARHNGSYTDPHVAPKEMFVRALRDVFAGLPDCRRGQGRKHRLETVLSICALARLAGLSGPVAAAQYAAGLRQDELRAGRVAQRRGPLAGAVGGDHLPGDGEHRPGRAGGGVARVGGARPAVACASAASTGTRTTTPTSRR